MKNLLLMSLLISTYSWANTSIEIVKNTQNCPQKICIGSEVNINSDNKQINAASIFLGQATNPQGDKTFRIILNKDKKIVNFISQSEFNDRLSSIQKILDSYAQVGGTCTGYALFNYLQQLNLSGFEGNGELAKVLSNEEGRSQLLADSINQYYLVTQHKYSILGILNSYGKQFGFKCKKTVSDSFEKIKTEIKKNVELNSPQNISFNIGPNMANSPILIKNFPDNSNEIDQRIWVPRKSGEKNSGGHSVVIASGFSFQQKDFLMMIDSDWSEPRIWSVENIFNEKTAIDEVELYSCK